MKDYIPPKYITVKQEIKDMLDKGELEANARFPSEKELMESYSVSRITIRRAIEELVHEGYLYKLQGKGTYVKPDKKRQDLISITSCTEDMLRLGMTPSRKVITSKIIAADKKRQDRLQLAEGEQVFLLERIYYADDEPINFTSAYLPCKLFRELEKYDFSGDSLYRVLEEEYGVRITRAERTLEAVIAYDEIREYLNVDAGTPLILFHCITYGKIKEKEYPIETFKCYYRSDRFKFCINQIRQ